MKELEKIYDPSKIENKIYDFWLDKNYFHTEIDKSKKSYTIVIPPPNITGQLHMGHALDNTLQDILIRFKRMQGYCALWIPGTDHASIATEAKIVEAMKEEGLTKDDLGRDGFLKRAWEWKNTYGGKIIDQLKKLGSSCDWQRERFTMDEGCSKAVTEVFIKLYEKELIYRGEKIINWCPHCHTSISDAEVDHNEKDGHFYHIKYPLSDGSGHLTLATTRPETLLGDTAVAVHPEDERYSHLIGKTVILPLVNKEIPIISDTYVERDFGTGVVKITPAHDPNDFEVGLRHNLPIIKIMDESAVINENGLKYKGMDRYSARKVIIEDLKIGEYLVKIENMKHNVGSCYRCNTIVEPYLSKQWFVKMEPLAKPAIKAVKNKETTFIPERFEKIYFHWMENIKDWCISRQLWWGHRIPAYYCDNCGKTIVSSNTPDKCPKCNHTSLTRDPDTLDTWFSSALWPFSTLGWPDKTDDLDFFFPTNTLVTGYDIIFFWVARMIFSSIEHMEQPPFDTVFIHGIVRDEQGRKMSKSLGNGIDPLLIIDEYGADALRFSLAHGNSPGNDMRFSPKKVESARNFANKLWNASRFILMNIDDSITSELPSELTVEDKWALSIFNRLAKEVTDNLESMEIGIAVSKLYDFIWDVLCDWYIELSKIRMQNGGKPSDNAKNILVYLMTGTLKLLHPFMPFITEEIWQTLPHSGESLMISDWPLFSNDLDFKEDETEFQRIITAIKAIRNRRAEINVPPSKKAKIFIETSYEETFKNCLPFIIKFGLASDVSINLETNKDNCVNIVTDDAKIFIPMGELIDFEAEKKRLLKELEVSEKQKSQIENKLNNPGFLAKAPKEVIDTQKSNLEILNNKILMINESINKLS